MKVVLERGSGEQQAVSRVELSKLLTDLALFIFELVRLINNDILPFVF